MSTVKKKRSGRPVKYPPEFQADAVAMVLDDGRKIADVARSLGVVEGTLGNWVARERARRAQGTELNVDERARLAELEHEVTELRRGMGSRLGRSGSRSLVNSTVCSTSISMWSRMGISRSRSKVELLEDRLIQSSLSQHLVDPSATNEALDSYRTASWDRTGRLVGECVNTTPSATSCDVASDRSVSYDYDPAGQLTDAEVSKRVPHDPVSWSYGYGNRGERIFERVDDGETTVSRTYGYDASVQLVSIDADDNLVGVTYTYDAAGRRTGREDGTGTKTYRYDPRGLLVDDGSTYHYDPTGYLGDPYYYDYSGRDPYPKLTMAGDDNVSYRFDWGQGTFIGLGGGDDTSTLIVYGQDLLGSVSEANGEGIYARVDYDPYGNALSGDLGNGTYRSEISFGEDLIYLRARYYDPATGSFITRDPLDGVDGTPTVANPYHYVDNDPLNKTDPLGLRAQDCNMNAGGCTVVVDDKQLGRVGAPYQGQGPPTGTQGMSWNHFNAASPTQKLSGYALGMLQSGASSDLAVLYHVVRQEAAGRDGGIANQAEDWVKYAGAAACDAGVGPACSRTGGLGLSDLSLGITNMQRGAYNTAKSHRCGAGGDDRSWTDVIGDSNYAIAMTAAYLNALDCDVMDYVRARPNQFKVESMGYLSGKTLRRGFQSGGHQLYKYDGDGNRVLSRNALNMFAYQVKWDEVVNVLEGEDLASDRVRNSWVERQNVAFNENGGGNLSDVYDFYCITGGPFSC